MMEIRPNAVQVPSVPDTVAKGGSTVLPVQFTTDKGENIALDVSRVAPVTDAEFQQMVKNGETKAEESFTIDRSTFTLFRLQGKIYSRVRNLDTGEVSYYPTLNTFSYKKPLVPDTGTLLEQKV